MRSSPPPSQRVPNRVLLLPQVFLFYYTLRTQGNSCPLHGLNYLATHSGPSNLLLGFLTRATRRRPAPSPPFTVCLVALLTRLPAIAPLPVVSPRLRLPAAPALHATRPLRQEVPPPLPRQQLQGTTTGKLIPPLPPKQQMQGTATWNIPSLPVCPQSADAGHAHMESSGWKKLHSVNSSKLRAADGNLYSANCAASSKL